MKLKNLLPWAKPEIERPDVMKMAMEESMLLERNILESKLQLIKDQYMIKAREAQRAFLVQYLDSKKPVDVEQPAV